MCVCVSLFSVLNRQGRAAFWTLAVCSRTAFCLEVLARANITWIQSLVCSIDRESLFCLAPISVKNVLLSKVWDVHQSRICLKYEENAQWKCLNVPWWRWLGRPYMRYAFPYIANLSFSAFPVKCTVIFFKKTKHFCLHFNVLFCLELLADDRLMLRHVAERGSSMPYLQQLQGGTVKPALTQPRGWGTFLFYFFIIIFFILFLTMAAAGIPFLFLTFHSSPAYKYLGCVGILYISCLFVCFFTVFLNEQIAFI